MKIAKHITIILIYFLMLDLNGQDLYQEYTTKLNKLSPKQSVDSAVVIISALRNTQPWIGIKLGHYYLSLAKSQNHLKGMAKILDEMGVCYRKLGKLAEAYSNSADAYDIYESLNDSVGMSFCLSNIGNVYFNYGDYQKAIENFEKSLLIKEKLHDQKQISYTLSYLGRAYKESGKMSNARELFFRALSIDKKFRNTLQLSKTLTYLGELELLEKNFYLSGKYLNDALTIFREEQNYFQIANLSVILMKYYIQMGDDNKFLLIAHEGLNSALAVDSKIKQMEIEKLLYLFYESKGDKENSFLHLKLQNELLTQVYNDERTQSINEITDLYALRKERQNLEHKYELEQLQSEFSNYIIYLISAVAFLVVLSLLFTIQKYRQRKKLNTLLSEKTKQLDESNKKLMDMISVRDTIFSIIAHDLKNPFNHLINASTMLYDDFDNMNDDDKKALIKTMGDVSDKAYDILRNLLDWAVIQAGNLQLHSEKFDMKYLIVEVISLQQILSGYKNVTFYNEINESCEVYADKNSVNTVLRNLLSNSVKFTHDGGKIEIFSELRDSEVIINVKDNGIGIPEALIESVFEANPQKARQGTLNEKGSGVGLILCKELIEKNGGQIWVSNTSNDGSVFSFSVPLAN